MRGQDGVRQLFAQLSLARHRRLEGFLGERLRSGGIHVVVIDVHERSSRGTKGADDVVSPDGHVGCPLLIGYSCTVLDDAGSLAHSERTFAVGQISRHDFDGSRHVGTPTAIDGTHRCSLSRQGLHDGLSNAAGRSQNYLQIRLLVHISSWILASHLEIHSPSKRPLVVLPSSSAWIRVRYHPSVISNDSSGRSCQVDAIATPMSAVSSDTT